MNALNHVAGWTHLHFLWQATLIALAAGLALRILRHASPHARYIVSCIALAAMAVSPLITARVLSAGQRETVVAFVRRAPVRPTELNAAVPPGTRMRMSAPDEIAAATTSRSRVDALLPFVVSLWCAGVFLLLLRLTGGWWRIRRLYRVSRQETASIWQTTSERIATRLGVTRLVHVVDSARVDTPVVVGWLKPVVLLPIAATSHLSPAQVQAILAHELAHVRRHDYLVNVLQAAVETLLFYHPAVWWISGRVRAEREHCCDDVAVEACGDPVGYAEALTELETRRDRIATLALAATGGSLIARVRHVLGGQTSARSRASNAPMAIALALLLIVGVSATQWLVVPLAAQRGSLFARRGFGPREVNAMPGQMAVRGFTGRGLIRFAYDLPESRVLGGPGWIDTESVDLSATLATRSDLPADGDWRSVIRHVLEERLQLVMHHETRDVPVFALVRSNATALGPNLRVSTSTCVAPSALGGMLSAPPLQASDLTLRTMRLCGGSSGITGMSFEGVTMSGLARALSQPGPLLDREVIDRTGLSGMFDANLNLGLLPASALMGRHPALSAWFQPLGFKTIFVALQEQLGLRLEAATAPVDVVVIDRAVRPNQQ